MHRHQILTFCKFLIVISVESNAFAGLPCRAPQWTVCLKEATSSLAHFAWVSDKLHAGGHGADQHNHKFR